MHAISSHSLLHIAVHDCFDNICVCLAGKLYCCGIFVLRTVSEKLHSELGATKLVQIVAVLGHALHCRCVSLLSSAPISGVVKSLF